MSPKSIIAGVVGFLAVSTGILVAQEAQTEALPQGAKKLLLKISSVESPETRTEKAIDLPPLPMDNQELPWSEADMAQATPEKAAEMADENLERKKRNRANSATLAYKNWARTNDHMRGLRAKMEGTTYGRQCIVAIDKFAGYAGEHFNPDCIEFFHRMDNDEGSKEKFLQDMGDPDNLACAYFIKLVFDDPRRETGKVTMSGQEMSRTKLTQNITFQVQNLSGKMIASGNVKRDKTFSGTNAVSREGREENMLVDLLEECLVDVAKRINDHFVAKVLFQAVSSVKNDEDFYEDGATLEIDGVTQQLGTEVALLKGKHTVAVELEGYKQKGAQLFNITKSGQQKIVMVTTNCKLTVTVKGPAGDGAFDASNATIELITGEKDSETLTSGEETTVSQGKYTLKVSMDGYSAKPQNLSLAKPKQAVTVSMQKIKEVANEAE